MINILTTGTWILGGSGIIKYLKDVPSSELTFGDTDNNPSENFLNDSLSLDIRII